MYKIFLLFLALLLSSPTAKANAKDEQIMIFDPVPLHFKEVQEKYFKSQKRLVHPLVISEPIYKFWLGDCRVKINESRRSLPLIKNVMYILGVDRTGHIADVSVLKSSGSKNEDQKEVELFRSIGNFLTPTPPFKADTRSIKVTVYEYPEMTVELLPDK